MVSIQLPHRHALCDKKLGKTTRLKLQLDELDKRACQICVLVSLKTVVISETFFSGCFKDSIKYLGEDKFREKYRFFEELEYHSRFVDSGIEFCNREINLEEEVHE